jgi:acyl-coenzyme A thioesterase PaaI-like protein
MQQRLRTLQEVEALSEQERVEYWASRTPDERVAAAWEMTKEHYRKLGLWHGGMQMDKSFVRIGRNCDLREAEESGPD